MIDETALRDQEQTGALAAIMRNLRDMRKEIDVRVKEAVGEKARFLYEHRVSHRGISFGIPNVTPGDQMNIYCGDPNTYIRHKYKEVYWESHGEVMWYDPGPWEDLLDREYALAAMETSKAAITKLQKRKKQLLEQMKSIETMENSVTLLGQRIGSNAHEF